MRRNPSERAGAEALVVTLGPGADVESQASGALETLTQQPGAKPAAAPSPVDQQHRNVGLDGAVRRTPIAPTTSPSASATSVVTPSALSAR